MKLNNKGFTLIELIVSIALMSVVLLFLYNLLADITFEKDNDYMATVNQRQRIDIIDYIEERLSKIQIANYNIADGENIYFHTNNLADEIGIYVVAKNQIQVSDKQFKIKGGTFGKISCKTTSDVNPTYVECTVPIYTTSINNRLLNEGGKEINNNNTLDDIIFSFKLRD